MYAINGGSSTLGWAIRNLQAVRAALIEAALGDRRLEEQDYAVLIGLVSESLGEIERGDPAQGRYIGDGVEYDFEHLAGENWLDVPTPEDWDDVHADDDDDDDDQTPWGTIWD